MSRSALLYGWLVALLATLPSAAQQKGATSAPSATPGVAGDSSAGPARQETVSAPPVASQNPPTPALRVTRAVSQNSKYPNRAALGDMVTVEVEGLATLLNSDSQVRCSDLVLFLDEIAIEGSPPESCSPGEGRVRFRLDRTDKSDHAWHILLSEPTGFVKPIMVSVGPSSDLAYPTDVRDFELEVLPRTELFCYFGMLAISLALLVRLARKNSLLRDAAAVPKGRQAPFSLSRFQLAFWSTLVIAAYLFIWMITDELDTLTGSVLVLLGIGSGTALSDAVIGSGKANPAGDTPAVTDAEALTPPRSSKGFLNDLLSDDHGISIYRFQLFAWTLVLGVIFCAAVYDGLQMPQFSTTLLGLMGLSSGTYLGFKVPEGKAPGPSKG